MLRDDSCGYWMRRRRVGRSCWRKEVIEGRYKRECGRKGPSGENQRK